MFDNFTIQQFIYIWIGIALLIFPIQLFVSAPYGRHSKTTWGPMVPNRLGWILMEGWVLIAILFFYIKFYNPNPYSLLFIILYALHYIHRGFIYPMRTRTKGKLNPILIVLFAMTFNSINAGLIGYYLSKVSIYPKDYYLHWNFIIGIILFISGFIINFKSDDMLIHLRKPGETGYKIPKGFLFKYISCPNHFGEMIEWLGFMLMVWNWAGIAFFVWTVSNLLPRALHHHKWYKQNFPEYPKERKAIFPFLL